MYGRVDFDATLLDVIEGFVDSDFAGCLDTIKSFTGYVFATFGNAISWKENLQKVVINYKS